MSVEWMVSSSGLILLVLLVRFFFKKKIPAYLRYALWLVVALRLLLPISIFETAVSILNLLPQQERMWEGNGGQTGQIIYEQNRKEDNIPAGLDMTPEESKNLIIEKDAEAQDIEAGNVKELFTNENKISISKMLQAVYLLGAGICGCIFLAVNLDYGRKLRRSRKKIEQETLPVMSVIPVYESQMIQTPCLFGLWDPAIYVIEDTVREEKTFRFVLCHENTHYRQHDHLWALVRIICLCVHWFNPLVWAAVYLSRQDGEVACDEKALKMLGDKVRIDYGKTLLKLSAGKVSYLSGWRISTTMSGGARQMKERLWMIVNAPGRKIWMQALVMILVLFLAVITFTGKSSAQERDELYGENLKSEEPEETLKLDDKTEGENQIKSEEPKEAEEPTEAGEPAEAGEPEEVEFYRDRVPVSIGGKEYELWCEGHTAEYGFYAIDTINLVDPEKPDEYVDTIVTEEISRIYWNTPEDQEAFAVESIYRDGGILTVDLNFDGWNDLCFQGWCANSNIPYYCMLWNPEKNQYEYSAKICNVEVDEEEQWIIEGTRDGGGQYSITYYRYDEYNQLHMVRYTEENFSPDAVFEQLDLTYVEDEESMYVLPAIANESGLHYTLVAMAKQALTELYQWTGEKVDTASFQVTNMGSVYFGMTPEDILHSRTFFDRSFGTDTVYNLSGYDKSISSMYITSGRSVWYSPVFWHILPKGIDEMTDEEIIIWYMEQVPLVNDCKVKSVEKRYEDMWTIQTESGVWFEAVYDVNLKEISMVWGPYSEYPVH